MQVDRRGPVIVAVRRTISIQAPLQGNVLTIRYPIRTNADRVSLLFEAFTDAEIEVRELRPVVSQFKTADVTLRYLCSRGIFAALVTVTDIDPDNVWIEIE